MTASDATEPEPDRVTVTGGDVNALVTVERFYARIWNSGDCELVAEFCAPKMTFRESLGAVVQGRDKTVAQVRMLRNALG